MIHLPPPPLHVSVGSIFTQCVQGCQDKGRRAALMECLPPVIKDSEDYASKMPDNIASFAGSPLPAGVSGKTLSKLYKENFAAETAPGRQYYETILHQPKLDICPICGVRTVRTLDHYLPKSKYPTLAVTPLNLVPCCRDCNFDKLTYTITTAESAPLHPYFDDISKERWLAVNVYSDKSVLYYAACPSAWSDTLKRRVERHLSLYKLQIIYGSNAAQEIDDSIHLWRNLRRSANAVPLKEHLAEIRDSAEANNLNSWKSALYRGLVEQFTTVETWL